LRADALKSLYPDLEGLVRVQVMVQVMVQATVLGQGEDALGPLGTDRRAESAEASQHPIGRWD